MPWPEIVDVPQHCWTTASTLSQVPSATTSTSEMLRSSTAFQSLLKDILALFLSLSDQKEFVHTGAGDRRSYRKELFERATGTARRGSLMPTGEIEKLRLFVGTVKEAR
jgi:hypothetical protein